MFLPDAPWLGPVLFKKLRWTFVAQAESVATAATITMPTNVRKDDICIHLDHPINSAATPTAVTPTGFTNLTNVTIANVTRSMVSYRRILEESEQGSTITGMTAVTAGNKLLIVLRPSRPLQSVTASAWNAEANAANPAAQAVNLLGKNFDSVIVFGAVGANAGTAAFSTQTPAFDRTHLIAADSDAMIGWKQYSRGQPIFNHSIDMNDLGTNNALHSGYLAFT